MNSKRRTPAELERAGAIHDANQLLAVIAGRAGLMQRRVDTAEARRQLAAIEQAARDVAALLARLDPGAPQPAAGPTRLAEAAQLTLHLILPQTGPEDVEIPADVWTAVPGVVVREALNNLLVNAMEAAGEKVRVRIAYRDQDGDHLLEVIDDGPGIAAEVADGLLDRQVSSKPGTGRGLGLYACRQRLQEHGGDLELVSTSPAGSVFGLRLPAAAAPTHSGPATGSRDAGRVLIVDDDAAVREMLTDVFGELGAQVTGLREATATRERFRAGDYELVVLDQGLPGTRGLDLARELREIDPAVAIALISGWGQERQLAEADPALVDFTAAKPLDWNRMQDLLFEGTDLCRRRRDA